MPLEQLPIQPAKAMRFPASGFRMQTLRNFNIQSAKEKD